MSEADCLRDRWNRWKQGADNTRRNLSHAFSENSMRDQEPIVV